MVILERDELIKTVYKLHRMWKEGLLGGKKMPEDENPNLDKGSEVLFCFFTHSYCTPSFTAL